MRTRRAGLRRADAHHRRPDTLPTPSAVAQAELSAPATRPPASSSSASLERIGRLDPHSTPSASCAASARWRRRRPSALRPRRGRTAARRPVAVKDNSTRRRVTTHGTALRRARRRRQRGRAPAARRGRRDRQDQYARARAGADLPSRRPTARPATRGTPSAPPAARAAAPPRRSPPASSRAPGLRRGGSIRIPAAACGLFGIKP